MALFLTIIMKKNEPEVLFYKISGIFLQKNAMIIK